MAITHFEHKIKKDGKIIFAFNWDFVNDTIPSIFEKITQIIDTNKIYQVVFDMKKIETINSSGAWYIASTYEYLSHFWWKLELINMNSYISDVLDLCWILLFINKK